MSEEQLDSRKACDILRALYKGAEDAKGELELSVNDTILNRRAAGLQNYERYLSHYKGQYENAKKQLVEFASPEILLDFIMEQAVSNPMILVDLAKALHVENSWPSYPAREIYDPTGRRLGY